MDFFALAQACAPMVDPQTLTAIVRTESAFRPWSIGINGGAKLKRQPASKAEAVSTAKELISRGYSIDMGLGQINSANLARLGLSVETIFDPCTNLAAAGSILHGNYLSALKNGQNRQHALQSAISAYNTGSFTRGISNGYVRRVLHSAGYSVPGLVSEPPKKHRKSEPGIHHPDTFTQTVMVYP